MQTTLRIDDRLYREAKAEAAREGVSLTRFLEEGLRLRLAKKTPETSTPHVFRVYTAQKADPRNWEQMLRISHAEQEAHDSVKLGLPQP